MIRLFRHLLTYAFAASLVLPALAVLASSFSWQDRLSHRAELLVILYCVVAAALFAGFRIVARKLERWLTRDSLEQGDFLDRLPSRFVPAGVMAAAGLSLFLELAMIRWQASMFAFFAFYKNFSLLACFCGLGIGYAVAKSRDGVPLSLVTPLFVWQFALLSGLRYALPFGRNYALQLVPFREQLSMGLNGAKPVQIGAIYLLLSAVFALTALAFLPIGQVCGRLMERGSQLKSYGWNLLGSLAGVLLMFLVSFLWTSPLVWFAISFLALICFVVPAHRQLMLAIGSALIALTILAWPGDSSWNRVYSPYQLLELGYGDNGLLKIRAAGHYFQSVHNLSNDAMHGADAPALLRIRTYYELPYRIAGSAKDVAIVGAGTGNDVAAALRTGSQHIEAIEIDPAILSAGMEDHPEHPYADPRVHPVVNDARSFFRRTDQQFDLIVYGLLDSHTLLSHASSVRVDSFVYTLEGLREARSRLKERGVLSLSFSYINDALATKIYRMMRQAFDGKEPICIHAGYDGSMMFLQAKNGELAVAPNLLESTGFDNRTAFYRNANFAVDVSTDDWPFLYMPRRVYPVSYLPMLATVILISFGLFARFLPQRPRISHLPFFFLGAGFMLVETKAITELGLTFGNTWHVVAVAIASILVMAFLANTLVQWLGLKNSFWPHVLILVALLAGWWIAKTGGLPSTGLGRMETALILTCPLFFSGLAFSSLLSKESGVSGAMATNLMGTMCGGVLEYNSMYFGFHFLYLLAMGLYLLSFASTFLSPRTATVANIIGEHESVAS